MTNLHTAALLMESQICWIWFGSSEMKEDVILSWDPLRNQALLLVVGLLCFHVASMSPRWSWTLNTDMVARPGGRSCSEFPALTSVTRPSFLQLLLWTEELSINKKTFYYTWMRRACRDHQTLLPHEYIHGIKNLPEINFSSLSFVPSEFAWLTPWVCL